MSTYAFVIIEYNGKYMNQLGTFGVARIDGRFGFARQYEEGRKLAEREKRLRDSVVGFVLHKGHLRDAPDYFDIKETDFYKI